MEESNSKINVKNILTLFKYLALAVMLFLLLVFNLQDTRYGSNVIDEIIVKKAITLFILFISLLIAVGINIKIYKKGIYTGSKFLVSCIGIIAILIYAGTTLVTLSNCISDKKAGPTELELRECYGFYKNTGSKFRRTDTIIKGRTDNRTLEFVVNGINADSNKWAVIKSLNTGEKTTDLRIIFYPKSKIVMNVEIIKEYKSTDKAVNIKDTVSCNYEPKTTGEITLEDCDATVMSIESHDPYSDLKMTKVYYKENLIGIISLGFTLIDSFTYEIDDVNGDGNADITLSITDIDSSDREYVFIYNENAITGYEKVK